MLDEPIAIRGLTSFVIESAPVFSSFVQNLYQYTEESDALKIFDKKYECLKESELMIITDILDHDVNSASVLKMVHDDLAKQISDSPEKKTKIEQLLRQAKGLVYEEMLDFEIDLESDDMKLMELLKAMRIKIEIQTDTIFERTFEIMQVFKYLFKKRLLVFINLGTYLTSEELASLQEYAQLQNISVLLVDRHPFEGVENQVILDEDFVVLT